VIKAIDNRLIDIFGKLVHKWSEWTGKSNFFLAKGFLILVLVVFTLDIIFTLIFHLSLQSAGLQMFLLVLWLTLLKRAWHNTNVLEKTLKEAKDEVLPIALYLAIENDRADRVLFFFFAIVLSSLDVKILLSTQYFSGITSSGLMFIFYCFFRYTLVCFNGGGGGKIRQILQQLTKRTRRRTLVASPTPA